MTINLDDVRASAAERAPGDFRRHPWTGAPLVSHPTKVTKAGEPATVQYGRPSGLGKQIEDGTNLARWGERMVAVGGAHPDAANLLARMAALGACPDSDEAAEWRREADSIAAELKRLARAHEAAERGTHMHAVVEDFDLGRNPVARIEAGEDLGLPGAVQRAMLEAWRQALAAAGLEVLAVERTCVNDKLRVAGTLDAIVRATRSLQLAFPDDGEVIVIPAGTVLLLDLKTGRMRADRAGLPLWWHSYAVQCWAYASSAPYNPDAEWGGERGEWPWEIDQGVALIAHLPVDEALDGEAVCRLIPIRLEPARRAAGLCVQAKAWAKRSDVFGQVLDIEPAVVAIGEGGSEAPPPDAAAPPRPAKARQTADEVAEVAEHVPEVEDKATDVFDRLLAVDKRRQRVLDRLAQLTGGARDAVRANWPAGVPGMKGDHEHTLDELDAIEATIARHVQGASQLRIQPAQPERRKVRADHPCDCGSRSAMTEGGMLRCDVCGEVRPATPATPPGPDEGGPLSNETVAAIKAQVARLSDTAKAVFGSWAAESATAGTPFSIGAGATDRRCAIYGALFALAGIIDEDEGDLDRVRATVALVVPDAAQLAVPLSGAIAALTIDEAEQLRTHAWAILGGVDWALCYDGEGDAEVVRWATTTAA